MIEFCVIIVVHSYREWVVVGVGVPYNHLSIHHKPISSTIILSSDMSSFLSLLPLFFFLLLSISPYHFQSATADSSSDALSLVEQEIALLLPQLSLSSIDQLKTCD